MKKLNNKGFVMAETLVVAVFIMGIFSIMYNNYFPLIGEYERREVFDDVDGKYAAFWIKRFIQHERYILTNDMVVSIENQGYVKVDCYGYPKIKIDGVWHDDERTVMCNRLVDELEVAKDGSNNPNIYLTKYSLVKFKQAVKNDTNYTLFSGGLHDYVEYLPEYSKVDSLNFAQYRIIVEFTRTKNDVNYYSYATIEVKK